MHESTLSAHSTSVAAARINSQPNQLVFRVPPFLTSSLDMSAALLRLLIWWTGVSTRGFKGWIYRCCCILTKTLCRRGKRVELPRHYTEMKMAGGGGDQSVGRKWKKRDINECSLSRVDFLRLGRGRMVERDNPIVTADILFQGFSKDAQSER